MHPLRFVLGALAVAGVASLAGCASAPKPGQYSARELWGFACADPGAKTVTGSVWTKLESDELNGQFPATVRVELPDRLAVEVTNLIGAPQAWLRMEDGKIDLRLSAQNEKRYGKAPLIPTLGGLPLVWAPRIFAGEVPCPPAAGLMLETEAAEGAVLIARLPRSGLLTRYVYSFELYRGKPWVREIRVENDELAAITIRREEPFGSDAAPKRWSASSSRGKIQVRWKDRNVSASPQGKQ